MKPITDRRVVELVLPLRLLEVEATALHTFANTDVGRSAIGLCRAAIDEVFDTVTVPGKKLQLVRRAVNASMSLQIPARHDDADHPVRRFNVALAFLRDTMHGRYPYGFTSPRFSAALRFFASMVDARAAMSDDDHQIDVLAKDLHRQAVVLGYYAA